MKINNIIKIILFAILSVAISIPLQLFNSIVIQGEQGKPEFVTIYFILYMILKLILFSSGYLLIGYKIPINNSVLRAFCYYILIWLTNYMPQVFAMLGGESKIVNAAFSPSIFLIDTITYLIQGCLLGLVFRNYRIDDITYKPCTRKSLIITCFISGVSFSIIIFILENILYFINQGWSSSAALKISSETEFYFYIIFYLFMGIAGVLIPIFYRLTEYNNTYTKSLRFGTIYSIFIWTPVVCIMAFFGTEIISTIVLALTFIVAILIISVMNSTILKRMNP